MTRTGIPLSRCPDELTWLDVVDFVRHLDASSALVSELHPDMAGWQGDARTPMLIAQLVDEVAYLRYDFELIHRRKGAKKPAPPDRIPRPGVKSNKKTKHYGAGAIRIADFDDWWNAQGDAVD